MVNMKKLVLATSKKPYTVSVSFQSHLLNSNANHHCDLEAAYIHASSFSIVNIISQHFFGKQNKTTKKTCFYSDMDDRVSATTGKYHKMNFKNIPHLNGEFKYNDSTYHTAKNLCLH